MEYPSFSVTITATFTFTYHRHAHEYEEEESRRNHYHSRERRSHKKKSTNAMRLPSTPTSPTMVTTSTTVTTNEDDLIEEELVNIVNDNQDEEKENKNIESEPADPSDAIVNFLLITKVPCLSPKAVVAEEGSLRGSKLYDLRNKEQNNEIELDIVQYEQITYLMNLDTQSNTGTLISFEEGMLYISSNQ